MREIGPMGNAINRESVALKRDPTMMAQQAEFAAW